jgi:hypothetical protein
MAEDPSITLDRLLKLRRATRALADFLEGELRGYLDTLAPLLRPKRLLGNLIQGESTETYYDSERAFQELQQLWAKVSERPFRLRPHLTSPIPAIRVKLELSRWEELWTAPSGGKKLWVSSPLSWVLSYPGACRLDSMNKMLAGDEERNETEMHQFVLNACILHLLLERTPGIPKLLAGLRYAVEVRRVAALGELPLVLVRSEIPSVRPSPQVMIDAAELAGLGTFEEVLDAGAARSLRDPLRARLEEVLAEHAPAETR